MKMKFLAILLAFLSSIGVQADEFAIIWADKKSVSIKDGHVTMPGLRHKEERFVATNCHRNYLTSAQKLILEPRFAANERCMRDRNRSQNFELIIAGKKHTIITCTRLAPRFERIQGQMAVCNRQSRN
jgi:hypothetical protein